MKILQIHPIMKTLNGSERVLIELTNRFVRDGNRIEIVSLNIPEECKNEINRKVALVSLKNIPNKEGFWVIFLQYILLPFLTIKSHTPDIILAHASGSLPSAILLKIFRGIKVIYYCLEPPRMFYDLYKQTKTRLPIFKKFIFILATPFLKSLDRFLVNKTDALFTHSFFNKKIIQNIYKKKDIKVIYPGIDIKRYSNLSNKNNLKEKLGLQNKTVLLSVGKLHPRKNFELQIRTMKKLIRVFKNIHLLIIGNGPHRKQLEGLSQRLGLTDYITFTGFVPDKELPNYYQISDIFLFTAYREPFGIVIIEAMSVGKPVIVPKDGGALEFCQDYKNSLLFTQGSVNDLYQKIKYLIENPNKRREISKEAIRKAQTFTWGRCYKEVREIINYI